MTNLRHGHDALNRDGRPIDDWRSEWMDRLLRTSPHMRE